MTRSLMRVKVMFTSILAFAFITLCQATTQAGFTVFEAAGGNAAAISPTVDAFRAAVGALRQEIDWDNVPDSLADPNALPGNYFNSTSPLGAEFSTPGTGFLVSANAGGATPTLFGFPNDFSTFSAQRLFTAVNSNTIDVSFFVPGTSTAATTTAFGLVFTDLEVAGLSKLEFFDKNNSLLFSRDGLVSGNQGLTFLGGIANAGELISRVRITAGLNTIVSNGVLGNSIDDVVALDDLIFANPSAGASPVPEPSTFVLALIGISGCLAWNRGRRRT